MELKQSYKRKSNLAFMSESRYARAYQFKRAVKESKYIYQEVNRKDNPIGKNVVSKKKFYRSNILICLH